MSKFDKGSKDRTVANTPLQQSSFVFFPEEETIRRKMLENPEEFLLGAENALEAKEKKIETEAHFLKACCQTAAKAAKDLSALAGTFSQKLPQSVFGVGDGSDLLIPLDSFFETLGEYESGFEKLLLKLDRFWQPEKFDPARFAFFESVVPKANVAEKAKLLGAQGEAIRRGARALSERIDAFCQTVIKPFFAKAGEAADLNGEGRNMRFGRLRALCGELQSAADRFARDRIAESEKIGID